MSLNFDHLVSANQALADHANALGQVAVDGIEQLLALNLSSSRSLIGDRHAYLKSLFAAKNPQEAIAVVSEAAQPEGERVIAYSRTIYEIAAKAQEEWLRQLERQQADWSKSVAQLLDSYSRAAPGGADVAIAAARSAVSAANSAFDSVNKAARQVASIADASVAAASSATVRAVGAAPAASRKKAA